eukprot:GHUV01018383.1.p2 GENE.GHUV01018383.1~~GHUV01018383.1.p2  ORF type:complete len:127 (-),score=31.82 GHUV01018383.1:262-642(-)
MTAYHVGSSALCACKTPPEPLVAATPGALQFRQQQQQCVLSKAPRTHCFAMQSSVIGRPGHPICISSNCNTFLAISSTHDSGMGRLHRHVSTDAAGSCCPGWGKMSSCNHYCTAQQDTAACWHLPL